MKLVIWMKIFKKKAVIIGSGGQGKVVLDILSHSGYKVIGFINDNPEEYGKTVNGIKILGTLDDLVKKRFADNVIVGIGNNETRAKKYLECKEHGFNMINAIHPKAVISKNVEIGSGVVIMPGAIINTNAKIGNDVIINTNSSVDHDNVLEDHCQIQPGAVLAGTVTVKEYATIGSGSTIIPNITVGRNSIVGAGSVVIRDVSDNKVVVGVPAKILKEIEIKKESKK